MTPDPSFAPWFGNLALVISVAANLALIIGSRLKQRREVTLTGDAVTKPDYDRHIADCREQRRLIYARIAPIETALAGLGAKVEAKFEDQNQRLVLMDQKLDRLIEHRLNG